MNEIIWIIGGLGACALLVAFCVWKGFPFEHPSDVQEFAPGETLGTLTADLELAIDEAVRELDVCVEYITRKNWQGLSESEIKQKRVPARRRYIFALEAWRTAQECLQFDGTKGSANLRLLGSIPLVRRAGIQKAKESAQLARELQTLIRDQG